MLPVGASREVEAGPRSRRPLVRANDSPDIGEDEERRGLQGEEFEVLRVGGHDDY